MGEGFGKLYNFHLYSTNRGHQITFAVENIELRDRLMKIHGQTSTILKQAPLLPPPQNHTFNRDYNNNYPPYCSPPYDPIGRF